MSRKTTRRHVLYQSAHAVAGFAWNWQAGESLRTLSSSSNSSNSMNRSREQAMPYRQTQIGHLQPDERMKTLENLYELEAAKTSKAGNSKNRFYRASSRANCNDNVVRHKTIIDIRSEKITWAYSLEHHHGQQQDVSTYTFAETLLDSAISEPAITNIAIRESYST